MASNDSTKKTLTVAFALCIVCSIIVSTAAVALRSQQEFNQEADRKSNILQVAGLYQQGVPITEQFEQVTARAVNLETGEYTDEVDPEVYQPFEAASDPAASRTLSGEKDIAGLSRQEKYSVVYLVGEPENPEKIILPIRGQGLWGLMRGYIALKGDGNSIVGITFYSHAETPGLGGEVDNPKWKSQWEGKKVYKPEDIGQGWPEISLVKSGANGPTEVDALSGASLTSRGVTALVQYWLSDEGFGKYLAKFYDNTTQGA